MSDIYDQILKNAEAQTLARLDKTVKTKILRYWSVLLQQTCDELLCLVNIAAITQNSVTQNLIEKEKAEENDEEEVDNEEKEADNRENEMKHTENEVI